MLKLIGLAEIFCLIYSMVLFVIPEKTYLFEGKDLISKYGIYIENFMGCGKDGFYLDNSIHADEADQEMLQREEKNETDVMTIATVPTDLPHGSYEVEIDYMTSDGVVQNYTASGKYDTWRLNVNRRNVNLNAGKTAEVYSLYTGLKARGYQVTAKYLGNGYLFVDKVTIRETSVWKRVAFFLNISCILFVDIVFLAFNRVNGMKKRKYAAIFVFLSSMVIFSSIPVLTPYLYNGHDLDFHLYRIEAIKNALLSGQLPVRIPYSWLNGYGYASSIFYGELFLFYPAVLRIIGFTIQDAYKAYIILINSITCIASFWCFYKILNRNKKSALIGCAAYMLAPYRLSCLYLRASVGEYTAMAFLPIVLYGIEEIYSSVGRKKKSWLILALGVTGLIQSHVLTTIIAAIFVLLFCVVKICRTLQWKCLKELLKALGCVCLLNLWFIVPFLDYFRYDYKVTDLESLGRMNSNGAFLGQILAFFPSGGGISKSVTDGLGDPGEMSYTLGAGILIAVIFYLIFRISSENSEENVQIIRRMDFAWGFGIFATYMATIYFPWDFLQQIGNGIFSMLVQNSQFPWRFLSVASLLLSLVVAGLVLLVKRQKSEYELQSVVTILGLLILIPSGSFLSSYLNFADPRYVENESDISCNSIANQEYLPEGTGNTMWGDASLKTNGEALDFNYTRDRGTVTVQCNTQLESDVLVDVPILYYKGYTARNMETGEKLSVGAGTGNRVRVIIPQGYCGNIRIKFEEPWYWRISEMISVIFVILLVCYGIRTVTGLHGSYRKYKNETRNEYKKK